MKYEEFSDELYSTITEDNLYEMSDFTSEVTGLPNSIVLWVRADSTEHGHSRYRIKVNKNREFSAIYLIGQNPTRVKHTKKRKFRLTDKENTVIQSFIKRYSTLFVNLIDAKLTSNEVNVEILKIRGE